MHAVPALVKDVIPDVPPLHLEVGPAERLDVGSAFDGGEDRKGRVEEKNEHYCDKTKPVRLGDVTPARRSARETIG